MQAIVIEDSRTTRALLVQMLTELGFGVVEAGDGREGLRVWEAHRDAALILVDWDMPVMDGLTFLKTLNARLRIRPAEFPPRLIMVTRRANKDDIIKALETGADEYIMKPFDRDGLASKITLLGLDLPPN